MTDLLRTLDATTDAVREAVAPDKQAERDHLLMATLVLGDELLAFGRRLVERDRRYRAQTTLRQRLDRVRLDDREPHAPGHPDDDPPPDPEPDPEPEPEPGR